MVLHSDEPHPHVHMVVKAISERGVRLNIRKATLRNWRQRFATHLREQGIAANATERAVRGQVNAPMRSSSFRAMQRAASNRYYERAKAVRRELQTGSLKLEPSRSKLIETRRTVLSGWERIHDILVQEGDDGLATQVRRFIDRMPAPSTEKERMAAALRSREAQTRNLEDSLTR
jgi:type IV secretory pathway VirD2 relaxase